MTTFAKVTIYYYTTTHRPFSSQVLITISPFYYKGSSIKSRLTKAMVGKPGHTTKWKAIRDVGTSFDGFSIRCENITSLELSQTREITHEYLRFVFKVCGITLLWTLRLVSLSFDVQLGCPQFYWNVLTDLCVTAKARKADVKLENKDTPCWDCSVSELTRVCSGCSKPLVVGTPSVYLDQERIEEAQK